MGQKNGQCATTGPALCGGSDAALARDGRDKLARTDLFEKAAILLCLPMPPHVPFFISDNIKTVLGYGPEEIVSNKEFWTKTVHADDLPKLFAGFYHVFERGHHVHEYHFMKKDGTTKKMLVQLFLHSHRNGTPMRMMGIFREPLSDIAGSMISKRYSRSDEVATMTLGNGNVIRQASAFVERLTGYAPKELIGNSLLDFVPPDHACVMNEALDRILHRGKDALLFWNAIRRRDGSLVYLAHECTGQFDQRRTRTAELKSADITDLVAPDDAERDRGKTRLLTLLTRKNIDECNTLDLHTFETLTSREREILYFTVEGFSSSLIGERLAISPRTVEAHRAHLMKKLNVKSIPQLVRYMVCHVALPE